MTSLAHSRALASLVAVGVLYGALAVTGLSLRRRRNR